MKYVEKSTVIKWLQRFPRTRIFVWHNKGDEGCLFTRFGRYASGNPKACCDIYGEIKAGGTFLMKVAFHDEFWRAVGGKKASRDEAIQALKSL